MTVEDIAKAVNDLRAGRYTPPKKLDDAGQHLSKLVLSVSLDTVVNATPIYEQYIRDKKQVALYEDHECIFPAWNDAAICYENQYGNITVLALTVVERGKTSDGFDPSSDWDTDNPVDWSRVRWRYLVLAYVGGRSNTLGTVMPMQGPLLRLDLAVADSGEPYDIHWMDLAAVTTKENQSQPGMPHYMWDTAAVVLLDTLKFMACRNVELVDDKSFGRAVRRRLERLGVRVKTLFVRPVSSRRAGSKGNLSEGVPLHSVVGHPAHYGNCCPGIHEPKGLLFGKISGRFFIPQHARGSRDHGEVEKSYTLLPEG